MTEAPADRTYWHVPGARSWHAQRQPVPEGWANTPRGLCGRVPAPHSTFDAIADRVPADGHLCGSCARVIASRTDIENQSGTATAGIS